MTQGGVSIAAASSTMPYGLYISAEGAQAQSRRMEVLSNNLANVDTVGFKRDLALFQARFAEAVEQGLKPPGLGDVEDLGGGIRVADTMTDFSQGVLKSTGVPTDLAIDGEGFFQVRKDGQILLTRAGNFKLAADGALQTQGGGDVLSASGERVVIDLDAGPWTVTPDGAVEQAGERVPLALVVPRSLGDLAKVGDNTFSPLAQTQPVEPARRQVRGGYLEMSGVNPTAAMMELIETSRAIEANMKLIQNQDHMLGSLISRVLST